MAGVYIHIPFCKQSCYYCDFHFSTNRSYKSRMINAICREMALQKDYLGGDPVDTIYLGGGTPSILSSDEFDQLFAQLHQNFSINRMAEITLEANPDDLTQQKLQDLLSIGINRLSIGIQSFDNQVLAFLNRAHTSGQANEAYSLARKVGFENISIDLMFSIPEQSTTMLASDLENAITLNPEHISIYSLTIEEKTVFGNWHKKGRFFTCSDDASAEQFELVMDTLGASGFEQYEISNFCRDGFYSRHNTSYWQDIPYLGLGPGAHSYNRDNRQYNIAQNHAYMRSLEQGHVPFEIDPLNLTSKSNEYLLTSLRTKWGCNLSKLKEDHQYDMKMLRHEEINAYIEQGLLLLEGEILLLTRSGRLVADTIIGDLFQD